MNGFHGAPHFTVIKPVNAPPRGRGASSRPDKPLRSRCVAIGNPRVPPFVFAACPRSTETLPRAVATQRTPPWIAEVFCFAPLRSLHKATSAHHCPYSRREALHPSQCQRAETAPSLLVSGLRPRLRRSVADSSSRWGALSAPTPTPAQAPATVSPSFDPVPGRRRRATAPGPTETRPRAIEPPAKPFRLPESVFDFGRASIAKRGPDDPEPHPTTASLLPPPPSTKPHPTPSCLPTPSTRVTHTHLKPHRVAKPPACSLSGVACP